MKNIVLITVGLAFAGAVGARSLDEPALGGGSGVYKAPAAVTVCRLERDC